SFLEFGVTTSINGSFLSESKLLPVISKETVIAAGLLLTATNWIPCEDLSSSILNRRVLVL
ncbi:MAG: hypothetical protein LBI31_06750, partial [Zoogloeaceae bacterium]|nr:hypothetical protein [Zoogloeaceae bacterium]